MTLESAPPRKLAESRFLNALLTSVAPRLSDGDVIGVFSPGPVPPEDDLQVAGCTFYVRHTDSVLQIRQFLMEAEKKTAHLVLLTSLQTPQLGADVRARLFRHQLLSVDAWEAVRTVFHARQIDPRLLAQRDLAAHLVAAAPPDGVLPLPGGVLSADFAWRLLLERALGFPEPVDELRDILEWADSGRVAEFRNAGDKLRAAAVDWLEKSFGAIAGVWLRCVSRGYAADLLSLGLACRVAFHTSSEGTTARKVGAARLERYTDVSLDTREGLAWADAAEAIMCERAARAWAESASGNEDPTQILRILNRAEALLDEVHLGEFAWLSDVLPRGFEQRLARFAGEIQGGLSGDARLLQTQSRILACGDDVQRHAHASHHKVRTRRVAMAIRLLRWLAGRPSAPQPATSLAEQANAWVSDDSFVDRARLALHGNEPLESFAQACRLLSERATAVREDHNRAFGERLAQMSGQAGDLLGVEDLLHETLVPLARQTRVLLIVLDGLSWPVAHELAEDLRRLGWSERIPANAERLTPMLAAIPTVTEFSRASLLSGRLAQGDASLEKSAFASHGEMRSVSGVDAPPVLFHRAALDSAGSWEVDILPAIESPRQKVVGVVVNAVDDHLARDGQLHYSWNTDTIRPLPALLEHAARAERAVILVGDHGHVLDLGSEARAVERSPNPMPSAEAGERWRAASTGEPVDGEVGLAGPRVLGGAGAIVVPWSERIRYGPHKWGYHGGVTPQEALCPLVVVARTGHAIEGWKEIPRVLPTWWRDGPLVAASAPRGGSRKKPQKATMEEPHLFTSPRAFSVTRVSGQVVQFTLPIDPSSLERAALELLVRYGRATERQLSHELNTRRVGGIMEALLRRLEAEGWKALDKEAESEDGRIFVFRPERIS